MNVVTNYSSDLQHLATNFKLIVGKIQAFH